MVISRALLVGSLLFCTARAFCQSHRVARTAALPATEAAKTVGCGFAQIAGKNSTSVLFVPIESGVEAPLRHLLWSVGDAYARPLSTSGERILSALPGTGNGAWFATVQRSGDLHVYRVAADNRLHSEGTLHPEGTATAFSWARDGNGGAWLLLETISEERRFIEAFRSEHSRWHLKGIVAVGNLLTPRGIVGQRAVMCGQWIFSADAPPRKIPVEGQPDLAVTYPGRDGRVAELNLGDLLVRTSADAGAHWTLHAPAWPTGTQFAWPPEAIDQSGDAPTVRWVADARLVIKRFSEGRWHTLLDTPLENVHGLSGPAVTVGNRLLLFALCYRTLAGESDSIRIGIIENGSVHVVNVTVR